MAQVANPQLFHELSNKFPEVPEDLVKKLIEQNANIKDRCVEALSRESNRILYQTNPPSSHIQGLTLYPTGRERSTSGCSSGSDSGDGRRRSDSTGSRDFVFVSRESTSAPNYGQQSMHGSESTPAFTSTHKMYVKPRPVTAPVPLNQFETFMGAQGNGGYMFPPSIPCSVSNEPTHQTPYMGNAGTFAGQGMTENIHGSVNNIQGGQPVSNQLFYPPHQGQNGPASVPYQGVDPAPGDRRAMWLDVNSPGPVYHQQHTGLGYAPQQTQNVIQHNNRQSGYPSMYSPGGAWGYHHSQGQINLQGPGTGGDGHQPHRPEHFNQGFPSQGRSPAETSPLMSVQGSVSAPYRLQNMNSPDRPSNQSNPSPGTPTRGQVTPPNHASSAYGLPPNVHRANTSPGFMNVMPSNTPPGPGTASKPGSHHISAVYIPVNHSLATPPVNPPAAVYAPPSSVPYQFGGAPGTTPQGMIEGLPNQPPYNQRTPKRLAWSDRQTEGPMSNDWTAKDAAQDRISLPPLQPIITPSPTSSGGVSGQGFDVCGGQLGVGFVRRSSSTGSDDSAYAQALVLHQKARMEKLIKDLEDSLRLKEKLVQDVQFMENEVLVRRKARSNILSADDIQKVREENRRLRVDIELLTREIDMFNNGQLPLGWTGQQTSSSQNFHGNIPTGQTVSVDAQSNEPDKPDKPDKPARPPPPKVDRLPPNSWSPASAQPTPPLSILSLPPSHPPPPPSIVPSRAEPEEEVSWNCSACTFANHPLLDKCECCEMPRVTVGYYR